MTISIILYRESAILVSVVILSVVMLNVVVPLYDVAFASDLKNGTNPAV